MSFPRYFADADTEFNQADIVLFGVPFGKTSSFRKGAEKAPFEIRQASWNFETYDLRTSEDLKNVRFHDFGDLEIKNLQSQKMVAQVESFASSVLREKKFPLALGGEHSITPGLIKAFPKDIAVVSLDAHLDFREIYENDLNNHACVIRRISDHVDIGNIVVVGVRSAEKEEKQAADELGLFYLDAYTVHKQGLAKVIQEIQEYLGKKKIYLTLDMDVIDPAYAPGVCTPEPFGLTPIEILEILEILSPHMIGFDLVEICPPYDNGVTSLLGAKLVRSVLNMIPTRD